MPLIFRSLFFLFTVLPCLLPAQDFNDYQVLKSSGEIPGFLLRRSSEKFEIERQKMARAESQDDQKNQEDFLLQSNFTLDAMLLSGKVLFNDPVGDYLNSLKDHLLQDYPEARDSIKVFLVRSPQVNAFCTNNGIVLVHMGLLSNIGSEAQLAYVLCHEFQHYMLQHPINRYVNSQREIDQGNVVSMDDYEDFLLEKNRYSREQELEADAKGLELYLTSDYAAGEAEKVFEVMRYSYLPFENRPFPIAFFESEHFWLPAYLKLDEVQEISAPEDYDDTEMDHPNIAKRRAVVEERLAEVESLEGKKNILGEEQFETMRKICRFELVGQYVLNERFERAIYQAWLLLEDHPESFFLQKSIARSLFALVRYRNDRLFYNVHDDYEDIEGESQRLYYLMEQLNKPELNALALNYVWRTHQQFPEDEALRTMGTSLLDEFFRHNPVYRDKMLKEPSDLDRETMFAPVEEVQEVEENEDQMASKKVNLLFDPGDPSPESDSALGVTSRDTFPDAAQDTALSMGDTLLAAAEVDSAAVEAPKEIGLEDIYPVDDGEQMPAERARKKRLEAMAEMESHRTSDNYYLYHGFVDLFQDKEFAREYKAREKATEVYPDIWEEDDDEGIDPELAVDTREFQVNRKDGLELGLDKVVYMTPMVRKVNERQDEVDYLGGEMGRDKFTSIMNDMAHQADLDIELLAINELAPGEIEKFNDLVTLRSWLSAKMDGGQNPVLDNPYTEDAQALMEKYGTRYFGVTGGIFNEYVRMDLTTFRRAAIYAITFVGFPIAIYKFFRPRHEIYYIHWIWDLQTGKMVMDETRIIRGRIRPHQMKSMLYYSMLQITSQP